MIGADGGRCQAKRALERRGRQRERDGGAVGVRDQVHGLRHLPAIDAADDERDFRIEPVGVALVDDAVAEIEQARHVALAVVVIEGDQRELTTGRVRALELRGGAYLVRLAGMLERLIATGEQREFRAGPSALYQIQAFAADEPGCTKNADTHGAAHIM